MIRTRPSVSPRRRRPHGRLRRAARGGQLLLPRAGPEIRPAERLTAPRLHAPGRPAGMMRSLAASAAPAAPLRRGTHRHEVFREARAAIEDGPGPGVRKRAHQAHVKRIELAFLAVSGPSGASAWRPTTFCGNGGTAPVLPRGVGAARLRSPMKQPTETREANAPARARSRAVRAQAVFRHI